MSQQNDRYSAYDRKMYNQSYYTQHREELNRKRKQRRARKALAMAGRRISLQTVIPPEELEALLVLLGAGTSNTITITVTVQKEYVQHILSGKPLEIVLSDVELVSTGVQNFPKQSEGI